MSEPIAHCAGHAASASCGPEPKPDTVKDVLEHSRMERFAIAQALARRLRATTAYPPVEAAVPEVDAPVSAPHRAGESGPEARARGTTAQAGIRD
ncbi:MAG: hypothetical protein HY749_16745 [Gammaproteobacteria bacterium]|nr:hypothetical protein [Gammaproteobacteria bacterium]